MRTLLSFLILTLGAVAVEVPKALLSGFEPLPVAAENKSNPATAEKVALGRMLYFEPRISRDQKISCNSCHDLARYGVDGKPTSPGFNNQLGDRNSPTVFNAAAHFVQFWDGRAPDVEAQASGPVLNPVEMAAPSPVYVAAVLRSMPEYVAAFQKAFPGQANPVTLNNAALAIAAFERKLLTPARWDKFLAGDNSALTDDEKQGFLKFVGKDCNTCHSGSLLGAREFRKLGVKKEWPNQTDAGRAKVTGNSADRMSFKVPSLRNVTRTAPYLHDGKTADLKTAIIKMGEYQCGKKVSDAEAASIATWMESLTGALPEELIRPPALPSSTASTPKPAL